MLYLQCSCDTKDDDLEHSGENLKTESEMAAVAVRSATSLRVNARMLKRSMKI